MKNILIFLIAFATLNVNAQDTFSIVAVNATTGEVGSAGASCLDLDQVGMPTNDFLGQLIPNVGAINTQAYYSATNQTNATNRMNLGDTPNQIIDWLIANDVSSQPQYRQYGIAAIINESPETAAHTGSSTDNYKNHIVGSNYSIQGNILLGQEVLDEMESRFLNETGDLACKLMAALQGANMIGADSRCHSNGTSSLFAFVKVAKPTDTFGSPSFRVSVRTADNTGIEPIDYLQTEFDLVHTCTNTSSIESNNLNKYFTIYPNPSSDHLTIHNKTERTYTLYLYDSLGKLIYQESLTRDKTIPVEKYKSGIYLLKIIDGNGTFIQKIIIE